ncbi:MAG: carbonic anhydrase family protein [Ferruginibacter sp.]|nr:carbonic anhydrase family protein [Rhodoferax sp.]
MTHLTHTVSTRWALALLLCAGGVIAAHADEGPTDKPKATGKITLPAKPEPQDPGSKESMGQQVRDAIDRVNAGEGKKTQKPKGKAAGTPAVTITIEAEPKKSSARGAPTPPPDIAAAHAKAHSIVNPVDSKAATRAAALATMASGSNAGVAPMAQGGSVRWGYEGSTGPQTWAKLSPDFHLCAQGTRQSPISIDDTNTLQGPAEPLQIHYRPSGAMVLNNGRTIQVDVVGDNTVTVRGSTFKLYQIVFHHPSEERVNGRAYAMVAHLMHRDEDGQVAVVAVLLDPGQANTLINKVWTYMPLDTGDRVRMPAGLLDLNELLPQDMRYYQFMGSLTTPPCSENVLWMVLKQPVQISPEQLRLFSQLYPANARPVQPLNGRVVRDAQ